MGDGLLSLNWNNHGATFCHTLASLRGKDKYTDVTVSCGGKFYQVHKLVLSTCSEYFEKIFENTPCKHPVIVLRDIQCDELESLLNYMYKGVVSVAQSDLARLIKVAELLQIKGLAVPDEPPSATPTKSGSGKRTNEDRLSPRSSNDSSPYPKRRRRRESDNYLAGIASSSLASQRKNDEPQESSWPEDQDSRLVDDRLQASAAHEPVHSPVTVNVDETLVKEEILDDDNHSGVGDSDFGGIGDTSGDASQDGGGLTIPKFDEPKSVEQGPSPVSLPDPVVEALAGPSGLQGWADGGDMARRLPLVGEAFGGSDSQDLSSSVGLAPQTSGQPQQMVEMSASWESTDPVDSHKKHRCKFCSYSTNVKSHLVAHTRMHTGEKPYQCPYCFLSFTHRTSQRNHVLRHTGERAFKCELCPYRGSRKSCLRSHMLHRHSLIQHAIDSREEEGDPESLVVSISEPQPQLD